MADPKGFLKYQRWLPDARSPEERTNDYREIYKDFPEEKTREQAARCMDCGVPFCHNGCPLGNIIPAFNEAVQQESWSLAYDILSSTNNFPEFTGRICPAPCEAACVLGINQPPVAIEHIEKQIAEQAFQRGLIRPQPPVHRTGRQIAIVGSGPAGLAAADQLNKAGHFVTVFERQDRIGGLLRYGIPDFKLEKWVLDRRLGLLEAEGIRFRTGCEVGVDLPVSDLQRDYDAILLCGGSTVPRDLPVAGRELAGIHFAMDYLEQSNRRVAGDTLDDHPAIDARGKHVLVIGGGDTGSDCVGTANRQGARSVTQIEWLTQPPQERDPLSWPKWPMILRTSTSHEEGCERDWALLTKGFVGDDTGRVQAARTVRIDWTLDATSGRHTFCEIPGTETDLPCDLVLLAVGFQHPLWDGLLTELAVDRDDRHNVRTDHQYATSVSGVFAAGDMRRGQSLVVWAIAEGREAARAVDTYLMGHSDLPQRDWSNVGLLED